jgi:antitoxin (DNA-binding transcriptional repressor) of toxin-antitoxin stability system
MQVGTKELKNRLSHYLRLIRAGETVLVTDRGAIIAELRPVAGRAVEDAALVALARQGAVTLATGKLADLAPARRKRRRLVSDMITEDRR